jgi:hypothetical protein
MQQLGVGFGRHIDFAKATNLSETVIAEKLVAHVKVSTS